MKEQLFIEQYCINHILNNRGSRDRMLANLSELFFTVKEHKQIFSAAKLITKKRKKPINIYELIDELRDNQQAVATAISVKQMHFIDNT